MLNFSVWRKSDLCLLLLLLFLNMYERFPQKCLVYFVRKIEDIPIVSIVFMFPVTAIIHQDSDYYYKIYWKEDIDIFSSRVLWKKGVGPFRPFIS